MMSAPKLKRRKLSSDEGSRTSLSDQHFADFDSQNYSESESIGSVSSSRSSVSELTNDIDDQHVVNEIAGRSPKSQRVAASVTTNVSVASKTALKHRNKQPHPNLAKDATKISKSELQKLQVDELVKQVRRRSKKDDGDITSTLRVLKNIIESLPNKSPLSISEAEQQMKDNYGIVIPFPKPRPPKNAMYKFVYEKPENINVTGSYSLGLSTSLEEQTSIDLIVTMSDTLFEKKDYLNYRFCYKRAYYLACIAAGIKDETKNKFSLRFKYLNGDYNMPVLAVESREDKCVKNESMGSFEVQIMPVASTRTFPAEKILPSRNCVRSTDVSNKVSADAKPTSFYNGSIRSQCTAIEYLKLLHSTIATCEGFKDACILGRIWLRQRDMSGSVGKGGFGSFEWAAMLAVLLQDHTGQGKISKKYNSFQLFMSMLYYLSAASPLENHGRSTATQDTKSSEMPKFFDEQRQHNILYKMTSWSYRRLQMETESSILAARPDALVNSFESLFIFRLSAIPLRFDLVLEYSVVRLINIEKIESEGFASCRTACQKLHDTLYRGLGNRAKLIWLILPDIPSWDVGDQYAFKEGRISVCINLNASVASRTVDHGPLAENKDEALDFRKFWGDKAELRRFKDGSIMESLVWSGSDTSISIPEQIVEILLERHFGKKAIDDIRVFSRGPMRWASSNLSLSNSPLKGYQILLQSYSRLENDIRSLDGLPLQIRHIFAADAQLRYASVEEPSISHHTQNATPADVVLLFESSSQWPDNLLAVQSIKTAFLLKIADLLEDAVRDVYACLGLENQENKLENQSYLDITYDNGVAFRLRLHHDREVDLLQNRLRDGSLNGYQREETANALAAYKRIFLCNHTHTQYLQTLCSRNPTLSTTVRMLKEWFSSHLLSNHFSEETIETFAAHVYLHPIPWLPPASAVAAFLRVLALISRWNWREEPFIADFDASIKTDTAAAIHTRFTAWRKLDPILNRVVMFVATPADLDGTIWTDHAHPSKVVAARMTALAHACTQLVEKQGLALDFPTLFKSPQSDYDFVIHLNHQHLRLRAGVDKRKSSKSEFKNLSIEHVPVQARREIGSFNVVSIYLEELNAVYGQAVVLFHGMAGCDVIAGLWVPAALKRGWKVRLGYSSVPSTEEGGREEALLNKESILNEIARLGGDLVKKIEVMK